MNRSIARMGERTWLDGRSYLVKEDPLDVLVKSVETNNKAIDGRLSEIKSSVQEVNARVLEIEQKMVRSPGDAGSSRETAGTLFAKSDAAKSLNGTWRGTARVAVKAATLTSLTTDAAGSVGDLADAHRPGLAIMMPRRRLRMRELFMPGNTSKGSIEWPKMVGRTNGAATQTEGATKGQSDMQFDLLQWPVRTIAHFIVASKQMLDDVPALESLIDGELTFGVKDVEDQQLLNGAGTGTDLLGVYTNATEFDAPFEAAINATLADVLLQAIAQVELADYEADGIVLNPLDWRRIQSLKDDNNRYLGNGPFSAAEVERIWNMPMVATKSMSQGYFLVGACREGAQIFDREEAIVEVSTEDSDNFRRNLITLRGEERLAFVIKHPDAFVKGNFEEALAAS